MRLVQRLLSTRSKKTAGMCVVLSIDYRRDVIIPPCREAVSIKCDVTQWNEQVALFELATTRFGTVDIVVSSFFPFLRYSTPSSLPSYTLIL